MSHEITDLINEFEKPPQLIRIDKRLPKTVGTEFTADVKFVIHEEDEGGMTLRFVELITADGVSSDSKRDPRIPMIQPSPSA